MGMGMAGYIDIVCNLYTPREVAEGLGTIDDDFKRKVRMDPEIWDGLPIPKYIEKKDKAGIERTFLAAARMGDLRVRGSAHIPYERVHQVCQEYPDRFSGLAGIDPTLGMQQLYELERAVKEFGFIGAHYYPHWFDIPPDHPYIFPVYAKCIELDIPIMMQVGHSLIYQKDRRLPSVGRPITLDRVAIHFPELRLIGMHLGVPWTQEMISMAWKHENIYIGGDAYAPKHWPPEIVHYANTYGQDKFMFGTDWTVVDPVRAVEDVKTLNFRPGSLQKIMRDNAMRVFNLKDHVKDAGPSKKATS
jgi:predicted TIM-barrel fold metal-dependent hydrolase